MKRFLCSPKSSFFWCLIFVLLHLMLLVLGIEVKRKRTSDGGLGKMFHYHLATEAFWTDSILFKG